MSNLNQNDPLLSASLLDYICYRNWRSSLQEIRLWMGDNRFLEFLATFAGSYLILPNSKEIDKLVYDYQAALLVKKIEDAKKKKDLMEWNHLEGQLLNLANRRKRTYRWTAHQGRRTLRKIEKTRQWIKGMKVWEKKYLKQEDDQYANG